MTQGPEASPTGASPADSEPAGPSVWTPVEVLLWGILGVVILGILGLTTWMRSNSERPTQALPLPIITEVPDFSLTNRDGSTVDRGTFLGEPWVADFIFTRCAAVCPRMSQQMQRVVEALGEETTVRFVSFSVDPEYDTPEVLAEYAGRFQAPSHWYFLTGDRQRLHALSKEGFLLSIAEDPAAGLPPINEPIIHSNRFVLVDQEGRIRSYYDAFDDAELERLLDDLEELVASGGD